METELHTEPLLVQSRDVDAGEVASDVAAAADAADEEMAVSSDALDEQRSHLELLYDLLHRLQRLLASGDGKTDAGQAQGTAPGHSLRRPCRDDCSYGLSCFVVLVGFRRLRGWRTGVAGDAQQV